MNLLQKEALATRKWVSSRPTVTPLIDEPTMANVLAVFGATGQQGDSVISHVLNDVLLSQKHIPPALSLLLLLLCLFQYCKKDYDPNVEGPKETSTCEPSANGFRYEYDGDSKSALLFPCCLWELCVLCIRTMIRNDSTC
jgi:hypothetical protein